MEANATTTDTVTVITATIQSVLSEANFGYASPTGERNGFYIAGGIATDRGRASITILTEVGADDYIQLGAHDDDGMIAYMVCYRRADGSIDLCHGGDWVKTVTAIGEMFRA